MRYKACSLVESKDKILNPKLDGLHKHARKINKKNIFHEFWLVSLVFVMTSNTKKMKGIMLVGVHILLQNWWLMKRMQKN